ncbi:MAG: helix-turn-helix domain containing protein [Sphaerochaetaceae bacterium]|nr:helix-turn-helix domain containing protein [Sphaerochaetaceae bacterium]
MKSIRNLSNETGIPYQTIVNQRTQGRYPTVEMLYKIAKVMNVSLDWLLLGKERKIDKNVLEVAKRLKEAGIKEIEALNSLIN